MKTEYYCDIHMLGCKPFYEKENVTTLINKLDCYPKIAPNITNSHDFDKEPLTFESVWQHAQLGQVMSSFTIQRRKKHKGFGSISSGFKPEFEYLLEPTVSKSCVEDLYRLGEELVEEFHPQFFITGHCYSKSDWQYSENIMHSCWVEKLHGLSWRTVFGPHYIDILGRDFLLNIPQVIITELDWGGIRIDLAEKPWELSYDELYEIWKPAYDYLYSSGYYATLESNVDENNEPCFTILKSSKLTDLDYEVPISQQEKTALLNKWSEMSEKRLQAKADAKKAKRDAIRTARKSKDPLSDNLFNQLMDSASSTEMVTDIVVDNIDLKGMRLPDLYLECAQFTHNFMQRAVLADSCFMDCDFENNFMSEAISQRIKMMDSRVHECDFEKAELYETQLTANTFTGCNFQGADLRNSEIMGNTFVNCDFTKARLNGSDFQSSSFENCNFTKTAMGKADMSQAIFINCTLDKKYAKYAKQTGHEE